MTSSESNSGAKAFSFTVNLSHPSSRTVSVSCATADGSAIAVEGDYTTTSGFVSFTPGQISRTFVVQVGGDTTVETDETFTVTCSSPMNALILDGTATGRIANDD